MHVLLIEDMLVLSCLILSYQDGCFIVWGWRGGDGDGGLKEDEAEVKIQGC